MDTRLLNGGMCNSTHVILFQLSLSDLGRGYLIHFFALTSFLSHCFKEGDMLKEKVAKSVGKCEAKKEDTIEIMISNVALL